VLDYGIEPPPISLILLIFNDQDNARFFSCFGPIIQSLSDGLIKLRRKVNLHCMGPGQTIAACLIWQNILGGPVFFGAPCVLVVAFRVRAAAMRSARKEKEGGKEV